MLQFLRKEVAFPDKNGENLQGSRPGQKEINKERGMEI